MLYFHNPLSIPAHVPGVRRSFDPPSKKYISRLEPLPGKGKKSNQAKEQRIRREGLRKRNVFSSGVKYSPVPRVTA